MKVIKWSEIQNEITNKISLKELTQGSGVTIGSFDGLHIGHRKLIDLLLKKTSEKNLIPIIATFSKPLPNYKHSSDYRGDISTLNQRLSIFEELGVQYVLLIDFSDEFAKIGGTDFFSVLQKVFNMKLLVEGFDFRCGYKGSTDCEAITYYAKSNNLDFNYLDPVIYESERVSSSYIRKMIMNGFFSTVNDLLLRNYEVDCSDVESKINENILYYDKSEIKQVLPEKGIFNVLVKTSANEIRTRLVVSSTKLELRELNCSAIPRIQTIKF